MSLTDPDLLIHCYWLDGLPDDDTSDRCEAMILYQAREFYEALRGDV